MARNGTFQPNSELINQLRRAKGLSVEKLSERACISRKTLDSILSGNAAFRSTLEKIARVLEISSDSLIIDQSNTVSTFVTSRQSTTKKYSIEIIVRSEFDKFDETSSLVELLSKLVNEAGLSAEITDPTVEPGSVKVSFSLGESDLIQLVRAFRDCKLDELEISGVEIPREALIAIALGMGVSLLPALLPLVFIPALGAFFALPGKFSEKLLKTKNLINSLNYDSFIIKAQDQFKAFEAIVGELNKEFNTINFEVKIDSIDKATIRLTRRSPGHDKNDGGTLGSDAPDRPKAE